MINISTHMGGCANVLISCDVTGLYSITFERMQDDKYQDSWEMTMSKEQFEAVFNGMRKFITSDKDGEYINADELTSKLIDKYSADDNCTEYDRAINDAIDIINNMTGGF